MILDDIHDSEFQFISFCTAAFHQIENLINYFYWRKFPDFTDLLQYLLENNPGFAARHKSLGNCKRFKRIKDLDINVLVYLFEKEFYYDKKISYQQEITMLRDIRNDDSHRCEVDSYNQKEVLEDYEALQLKWAKYRKKRGQFPKKPNDEKVIEYKWKLIQFKNKEPYNVVRKTLKKVASEIGGYDYSKWHL